MSAEPDIPSGRTDEEATEILEGIRWQIYRQTAAIVKGQPIFDDAQQEAMLWAWLRLREGHGIGIAMHKAKQAVLDLARGGRPTGSKMHSATDLHRRAISIQRKSTVGEEYDIEPADHRATAAYDQIDAQQAVLPALSVLRERDREIVQAYFWEGLTMAEIGERLGMTGQGVSFALRRAYGQLREQMVA